MADALEPQEAVDRKLIEAAIAASGYAYAPYSKFPVGAAALTTTGALITGANVENASYGLTLCAETALVAELVKQVHGGDSRPTLRAVAVVNPRGEVLLPCGRCRQVLSEFATAETTVLTPDGFLPLTDLLPMAFGPADLETLTADPRQEP